MVGTMPVTDVYVKIVAFAQIFVLKGKIFPTKFFPHDFLL